jgi:hypothetical protein
MHMPLMSLERWPLQPPLGARVMTMPQYGQPTPAAPAPKSKAKGCAGLGCGLFLLLLVIGVIATAVGGNKTTTATSNNPLPVAPATSGAAAPAPAPATTAPAAADTVTYVVTGSSSADIQYGPAGSSAQGHAPMSVTKPLGKPQYVSISAQLQGGGSVSCQIKVNGNVISKATASGGYNIATCEISQNPLTGEWVDTNGG